MIQIRKSQERGHFNHGWLDTFHTFSFASYFDRRFMGFRSLRVINEDRVAGGEGFGTHGHRDMEIISYVLSGALAHEDSMGHGSTIRPGDVQYMSAGTGVTHSEFNGLEDETSHFMQIWILPDRNGYKPAYDQRRIEPEQKKGRLKLVASPDGAEDSIRIRRDVRLYASILEDATPLTQTLAPGRHAWVQVLRGQVRVNDHELAAGDGAQISEEPRLQFAKVGGEPAEFLFFDLD